MTRQTSIDAYRTIESQGLLSALRFRVYEHLFHNGPCTAKEVDIALRDPTQASGVYQTRLSELRDLGVVREIGKKTCQYSGHSVILWDVTKSLPKAKKRQPMVKCPRCSGSGKIFDRPKADPVRPPLEESFSGWLKR